MGSVAAVLGLEALLLTALGQAEQVALAAVATA